MADDTTEELTLDDATLASLDIPEPEPEVPAEPEGTDSPEPEPPPESPEPESPRETREQQLARELAEQRGLNAQLARDLAARSQPAPAAQPQHQVDPWSHLPAEQQKQWEGTAPIVRAIAQQMIGQVITPLIPAIQRANEANERLSLRNTRHEPGHPQAGQIKYPDAADYEDVAAQMRWNHYQQTGQWQPLELAYLVAKGAGLVQATPAPIRAAAQRTATKRGQASRTAAAGNATPGQGQPATSSKLTVDRVNAMSDEDILNLGVKAGIPRLRLPKRGVAA